MHLAYIWIVSHLSAKNYRNLWKFDEVLTKTNLLSFFWDTVYTVSQKNIPDIFSCNSRKHCQILIMFGKYVTENVSALLRTECRVLVDVARSDPALLSLAV